LQRGRGFRAEQEADRGGDPSQALGVQHVTVGRLSFARERVGCIHADLPQRRGAHRLDRRLVEPQRVTVEELHRHVAVAAVERPADLGEGGAREHRVAARGERGLVDEHAGDRREVHCRLERAGAAEGVRENEHGAADCAGQRADVLRLALERVRSTGRAAAQPTSAAVHQVHSEARRQPLAYRGPATAIRDAAVHHQQRRPSA
jgi:hypothetical protein